MTYLALSHQGRDDGGISVYIPLKIILCTNCSRWCQYIWL